MAPTSVSGIFTQRRHLASIKLGYGRCPTPLSAATNVVLCEAVSIHISMHISMHMSMHMSIHRSVDIPVDIGCIRTVTMFSLPSLGPVNCEGYDRSARHG